MGGIPWLEASLLRVFADATYLCPCFGVEHDVCFGGELAKAFSSGLFDLDADFGFWQRAAQVVDALEGGFRDAAL